MLDEAEDVRDGEVLVQLGEVHVDDQCTRSQRNKLQRTDETGRCILPSQIEVPQWIR